MDWGQRTGDWKTFEHHGYHLWIKLPRMLQGFSSSSWPKHPERVSSEYHVASNLWWLTSFVTEAMSSLTGISHCTDNSIRQMISMNLMFIEWICCNYIIDLGIWWSWKNLGRTSGPGPCILKYEFVLRPIWKKYLLNSYQGGHSSHKLIICHKWDSRGYCPEGNLLPEL